MNGGKQRWGGSGGSNKEYYKALYRAKGQGKEAMAEFIRVHGKPPSRSAGTDPGKGKGKGKNKDKHAGPT